MRSYFLYEQMNFLWNFWRVMFQVFKYFDCQRSQLVCNIFGALFMLRLVVGNKLFCVMWTVNLHYMSSKFCSRTLELQRVLQFLNSGWSRTICMYFLQLKYEVRTYILVLYCHILCRYHNFGNIYTYTKLKQAWQTITVQQVITNKALKTYCFLSL